MAGAAEPSRAVHAAYVAGLRMLVGRELSASQLRERLGRRGFEPHDVEQAVARLQREGVQDDRRVAGVRSRAALRVKHRGRDRVVRELVAVGIDAGLARAAVEEALGEVDERELLSSALNRRLPPGRAVASPAEFRRLYAYLLRLGFPAADVVAVLKRRAKGEIDEDAG
jgi:regulatory protein